MELNDFNKILESFLQTGGELHLTSMLWEGATIHTYYAVQLYKDNIKANHGASPIEAILKLITE